MILNAVEIPQVFTLLFPTEEKRKNLKIKKNENILSNRHNSNHRFFNLFI